ncbi:hypothetical protein Tco_0521064 [Tanacetum coccineum]
MTRSSTKELLSPFENPEQKFRSRRRLFDTLSLVESNSPEFDHNFDIEEQSEEAGKFSKNFVTILSVDQNTKLQTRGTSRRFLEIVDFFHIPKVTQDQIMLQAFLVYLTGATSRKWPNYSQKWHNGTSSRTKSTETSDGLASIQAQLNNLGREIKKITDKFMAESAKRHEENSNIIKEIRASTDAAIRNQGALIKTLEIRIGQMSKVLQERGLGSHAYSTKTKSFRDDSQVDSKLIMLNIF